MDQPCSSSVTFPEDGPSSSASASETNNSDDVDNSESDEIEEDEIQPFIDSYKENYKKFESKLFNNLQTKGFLKCFKKFSNALSKLSKSNNETFQRRLFEFSQNEFKTKKGKYISVQPTALARRKYKHRGKMAAGSGRRVKDSALKAQLICDNASDNV